MPRSPASPLDPLLSSPAVRAAAEALVDAVDAESRRRALTPKQYAATLRRFEAMRGRPLFVPLLCAGAGRGARVRMADGRMLLDFIGAIGVYAFGHSDRDLLLHAVAASAVDAAFQGHLEPGIEEVRVSELLLRHASKRLAHVWLSVSGAMANENALKLIWQKRSPADRIVVFENSFAGRTTTMAELTDKPSFREGLPLRGTALHVPFYAGSTEPALRALDAHIARYPGQIAAMMFELVQGEGGFNTAPREFFVALMERCRQAGIAVWVDEVQTFARTGELFAHRTFGLDEYVDLATVGKVLQGSAVLFSKAYNPRPGLVSGTYAGATAGMAVGARIIERLESEGYLGAQGKIVGLAKRVGRRFDALARRMPKAVGPRSGLGAMHAFVPFDGSAALVNAVIQAAFEEGLLLFGAGGKPMKVRMLLPVNVADAELDDGFAILEKALRRVGDEKGLAC